MWAFSTLVPEENDWVTGIPRFGRRASVPPNRSSEPPASFVAVLVE